MKQEINVILVEDNPQYREVIEIALSEEDGINLIDMYGAVELALHALQDSTKQLEVDIILLDINLPGMSGVDALSLIHQAQPKTDIIMLTQSNREADVVQAIQAGATGYLIKSTSITEIAQSIRTVADGGAPLDPTIATYVIKAIRGEQPELKMDVKLSARESDILELMSSGLVKKEIADQLNLSPHTIAEYVKNIYTKLGVKNAPSAVSKGYQTGLLRGTKEQN